MASRPVLSVRLGAAGLCGPLVLGACANAHNPMPSPATAYQRGSGAMHQTVDETVPGLGEAASQPLHDLNLLHAYAPTALVRAYARPYDLRGLDTCPALETEVAALDLALGPDIDIPQGATPERDMLSKGASLAAGAALDAVRHSAQGVLPVRSWVRRFSGANSAESEAKAISLAGSIRRGFLKAVGMEMGCAWPAAPLHVTGRATKVATLTPPAAPPPGEPAR